MFTITFKIMELSEKQQLLWDDKDPRFLFTLPINNFPVFDYRDVFRKDGTRILHVHDLGTTKSQNLVDTIDVAKTTRQTVAILHSADINYATCEETFYVFHNNKAQALLTEFRTRSSKPPSYMQTHAHLEFDDSYWLADKLVSLTLNKLQYIGSSPLNLTVEAKRKI